MFFLTFLLCNNGMKHHVDHIINYITSFYYAQGINWFVYLNFYILKFPHFWFSCYENMRACVCVCVLNINLSRAEN
jgi:hypothetical protein